MSTKKEPEPHKVRSVPVATRLTEADADALWNEAERKGLSRSTLVEFYILKGLKRL